MSKPPVACRLSSYGPFEAIALDHLASLGIRHVEMMVPAADQVERVTAELARRGMTATTLHAEGWLERDDFFQSIERQIPVIRELGTGIVFVALNKGGLTDQKAYARLRRLGELAAAHDLVVAVETHPDLATNGDVARTTMQAVDHSNVRINFDTANIRFYNRDADSVAELKKILDLVAAVHLKDIAGGYREWNFPALGRGVIDFPAVFGALDAAGFAGPYTIEIEGIEGETPRERLICDRVAESVGFLRGLGRL